MKINAEVKSIEKLNGYFFNVPDYQREYVWETDDQVEQFLVDIDNEYDPSQKNQNSYFIGSIIIVKNGERYDVIDGQQRLTTIVLGLCALRSLLEKSSTNEKQKSYLNAITSWLSSFDTKSGSISLRLELQYDESKDFLTQIVQKGEYQGETTTSIMKMDKALKRIKQNFSDYQKDDADSLIHFVTYFLNGIDLVVIESENLGSALKIFETINQRGAGLNAMDLVKNLIFAEANEVDFAKIKGVWKSLISNLRSCGEDSNPLRFLRYFLMARYHDGILREDDIYKWIISPEGKKKLAYDAEPLKLVKELEKLSKRYASLAKATSLQDDGGDHPSVTNIGYVNKVKSRLHLVLLLAPSENCTDDVLDFLATQIESFLFFSNTLGIQAKYNERIFAQWAIRLRNVVEISSIRTIVGETMIPYLSEKLGTFKQIFLSLDHHSYEPLYRLRYILGKMENTASLKAGLPTKGNKHIGGLQIEHILPQTPKGNVTSKEFEDLDAYSYVVHKLGNVALLEGQINQAVNNFNDIESNWFEKKQGEYKNSTILTTNLLDHKFIIGKDTALNRFREASEYNFDLWGRVSIEKRQKILLNLALDSWLFNGQRIDQIAKNS